MRHGVVSRSTDFQVWWSTARRVHPRRATEKPYSGQKNMSLTQGFAVRRALRIKKSAKRLEISHYFSRQGYASDMRSRQSFLTTAHTMRAMCIPLRRRRHAI
jgi:hypothetical protein